MKIKETDFYVMFQLCRSFEKLLTRYIFSFKMSKRKNHESESDGGIVIAPETIDVSNHDLDLNDPLNNVQSAPIITMPDMTDSSNFIIQFRRGQCVLDANNFLLLLNSTTNPNAACKLVRETTGQCLLTITINSDSPPHRTKCAIKCAWLDNDTKKVKPESQQTLSEFTVDFKQLSNIFKHVDRQEEIIIRRNGNLFTVEYETKEKDQCFNIDFHQIDVNEDSLNIPPIQYQYQVSVVTQKLKKFFDHAHTIANTMVIVRLYGRGKLLALKLELDTMDAEVKRKCETCIDVQHGYGGDIPMEAEDTKETINQIKEICKDQQNLVMISVFNKTNFMQISKIGAPSIVMNLGMNPNRFEQRIDPNTKRPKFDSNGNPVMQATPALPGMFAYNTGEVELSIYLVQYDVLALEGEVEFVRSKLQR